MDEGKTASPPVVSKKHMVPKTVAYDKIHRIVPSSGRSTSVNGNANSRLILFIRYYYLCLLLCEFSFKIVCY